MEEIKNLNDQINKKDNELEKLNQVMKNNKLAESSIINSNRPIDKIVVANFISFDQSLMNAMQCSDYDTFAVAEEKLYKEYPEYRETNNEFLHNGKEILRFKIINENRIGDGKPIMLIRPN